MEVTNMNFSPRSPGTLAPGPRTRTLFVFMVFLTAAAQGKTSQEQPAGQVIESAGRYRKEYVLAPGDQIEIVVRRVPEASRTLVIRPDGYISLPISDDIAAAGLTTSELNTKLEMVLAKRLVKPEVHVLAIQTRPPLVYVAGEVGAPSAVPLRNASTAVQAISAAGGMRKTANARRTMIIRLGEDGHLRAIPISPPMPGLQGAYVALASTELQSDDVVFVPESGRSEFGRFLEDFVNRPLSGITGVVGTYVNFKLISLFNK